ncbi:MAG: ABC transporter ATP-binding protein [Acidobacteriota bacterium]|nr:ABC transporter ATP-binding protein [Acidobacteriota bacterium]
MSKPIVKVEGLSKQYRLGAIQGSYTTLREALIGRVRAPLNRLRRGAGGDGETLWALRDVSFQVEPGEVLGIVGRNGAGKSTLLKILSRITEPTAGRAQLYGRVASLLEVGTGFHPELTGRENIFLNGAILGMRRAEIARKFDEIVAFAEIEKFIDTPVKRYSSGMYVRLAFAVAAHLEPDILVVDEVLAVGDFEFQKRCLGKMQDVTRLGRTVLFVSHNHQAIKSLCHRAIMLDHGRIEKEGDASSIVQSYLTGSGASGMIIWPEEKRPGNSSFKLSSVRLLDAEGSETSVVNLSEDFAVEICYEVVEQGAAAGFSLMLFDADGASVLSSLSNTERNFYGKRLKCGKYKSTCRLPGNLLNSGKFSFSIAGFSANWTDSFVAEHVLSFQAVDDGLLRGDYYGGYGGPIRPKLLWETEMRWEQCA